MSTPIVRPQRGEIATLGGECLSQAPPPLGVMSNGRLTSLVTATGSGTTQFGNQAVSRWRADPTCDALGFFIYVRDLDAQDFWSIGYQPTCRTPDDYEVRFTPGTIAIERTDRDIASRLEACVHQQFDVDLRRCTLTNRGVATRLIELTSYVEVVLQDAAADNSHPAFSKLFLETERTPAGVLMARRRPRRADEKTLCACHFLVDESNGNLPAEWETDRNRFIGRGRDLRSPLALASVEPLSGAVGSVLDPIFSLRTVLTLPPGASATVTFALGAGPTKSRLLEAASSLADFAAVDEAFQQADGEAVDRLRRLGFDADALPEILDAAASRIYGVSPTAKAWADGDGDVKASQQVEEFLTQHQITARPAPRATLGDNRVKARLRRDRSPRSSSDAAASRAQTLAKAPLAASPESLAFANGLGGFTADGSEYVLNLSPNESGEVCLPPVPWNNVISNDSAGFIASERGSGYTWASNSRLNRLTPWQNDPVIDPHSEALYLRDDETGEFWSLTPGPVPRQADYQVRHGWGYSAYRHAYDQIDHETTLFVPRTGPVKISWIRLTNTGSHARRLSLFSYVQWELGEGGPAGRLTAETSLDESRRAIYATNDGRGVHSQSVAFAALAVDGAECSFTADRTEFLGPHGSISSPQALMSEPANGLSGRTGAGLDPCAAIRATFVLEPGETIDCAMLLGETESRGESAALIDAYQDSSRVQDALAEVRQDWKDRLSAVEIKTPAPAIDLMINGWLPYQALSCRMTGRSSSYQSGGAYGFRDQLQDAAALVHHLPELTREQILRNAAHQFVEGDVLHWWHPPESIGVRTIFSDDLLWLPLATCEYVAATGDEALWQEKTRFLTSERVPAGHPEIYLKPEDSGQSGTLYEHCCRALDRGLTRGRNGLPLMGCGDWNDGMNCVGVGGTGESVWLGFFIDYILEQMLPVCRRFDDQRRFDAYTVYRYQLQSALNDAGWDGKWYRRAYFDDGSPLGTAAANECQIDALVQAWAVLSKVATPERAAAAIAAADERLVDEAAGIIRLLDPPFDSMPQNPGYIKGYLPGVRENGGQYTHGVLWLIRAMAELGQGTRACQLLEMISPVSHGCSPETVDVYKAEPYVVAADVYGQAPHAGRAGWSWYTGSAGWMLRVAVESILGVHLEGGKRLRIDPCISAQWPECRVRYRLSDRRTAYDIHIVNSHGKQRGVTAATLDGRAVEVGSAGALVPLTRDGLVHQVVVSL